MQNGASEQGRARASLHHYRDRDRRNQGAGAGGRRGAARCVSAPEAVQEPALKVIRRKFSQIARDRCAWRVTQPRFAAYDVKVLAFSQEGHHELERTVPIDTD